MFEIDSISDTIVADLLVADADELNAMVARLDGDSASSVGAAGDPTDIAPMSMSRSLKIRQLDEF
jgi:hypothetical protein